MIPQDASKKLVLLTLKMNSIRTDDAQCLTTFWSHERLAGWWVYREARTVERDEEEEDDSRISI